MILEFFLYYALVCSVILIASGLGLFIGYSCGILKDRHFIRKQQISYLQMRRTILAACAQCKDLQNELQNESLNELLKNKLKSIDQGLSAIQESLTLPNPELNNQYRTTPLFLYSGVSMIGLLLTTQVLTALLCLFLFGTLGVSLIAGSMTSNVNSQLSSLIFKYCNINMEYLYSPLTSENCTLLETSVWMIVAILFIILSISLIIRIIRLIVCQCEILFMGCRISFSILLSDLTKEQITEELEQMSQNIQTKNLSSYVGKIMHRIFD